MESVFNDSEKRFLLAEMIKLSQLDVGVLVDFVKSHDIHNQPEWMHMQLPRGRNMSQCVHAAEAMFNTRMLPPVISPLKRKSLDDVPDYSYKRQAIASPGEVSPRGFPPDPTMPPTLGAQQPVNIHPRPNGYASSAPAPTPSVSAAPYNPAPASRKRGRPPKSVQSTWHVTTYQPIAPSTAASTASNAAPQPHSPGLNAHSPHLPSPQGLPDSKPRKKTLPEIAPRPVQGIPGAEPAPRSPAVPGAEYQNWRDETTYRDYYHAQAAMAPARDRPASTYASILPRPRSPLPPPRELTRPASTEPRRFRETPPLSASEPVQKDGQPPTATEPIKT